MKRQCLQRKANFSPFWAYIIGRSLVSLSVDYVYKGHNWGDMYALFKEGTIYWTDHGNSRVSKLIDEVKGMIKEDTEHVINIRKTFDKKAEKVKSLNEELKNADYVSMSDEELLSLRKKLVDVYEDVYIYSEPIAWLTKDIEPELKDDFDGTEEEFNELITPKEKSFSMSEEESILRLAFRKMNGEDISNGLKEHTEKFRWIPYDYGVKTFSEEHFRDEIEKKIEKGREDIKNRLTYLESFGIEKKKGHGLFRAVREASYLMDYKKEIFTKCHLAADMLFREIARRTGIDRKYVECIMPDEDFRNAKKEKIRDRYNYFLVKFFPDGSIERVEDAEGFVEKFLSEYNSVNVSEIKGRSAYPGNVKGVARDRKSTRLNSSHYS